MTKEKSLDYYKNEYLYYQREIATKSNKLACFYDFLPVAYEIEKLRMCDSITKRIVNGVKKGTTRVFWPVIGHFNSHPACSFYDADNKLLDIQDEIILEYQNCLDTLVDIVDEENISTIYPLMRVTFDCFNSNLALIDRVSSKMRTTMIGEEIQPIDYTRFDLSVFLAFFDSVIGDKESLKNHNNTYQKIRNQ